MEQLVKIWCFNKAADLLGGKEKEIKQIFGENTEFAEREVMFRGEIIAGRDIMARNDALKEYFVPIAVKCIGGLFDSSMGPARKQLDKIRAYYEKGGQPYKFYWDDQYYRAGMMTDSYQGYYSLIEEDTKRKADINIEQKNILVGYSQGGLVARYLAYLDEYIFRPEGNGIIHGFITVAAPNLGSPLANEECRDHIAVQAIRVLLSLASLYGNGHSAFSELAEFISEPIKWEFFDGLIFKFRKGCVNLMKEGDDEAKQDARDALAAIEAVIRWTSGLRDDRKLTAFYDLNTYRLNKPHSVLAAVNNNLPKKIFYGAVLFWRNWTLLSLVIWMCTIRHGTQDQLIQEEEEWTTQSMDLTMVSSTGTPPRERHQTEVARCLISINFSHHIMLLAVSVNA